MPWRLRDRLKKGGEATLTARPVGKFIALLALLVIVMCGSAQTPIDEKEEPKPPKVRTDLPLLPPLETLARRAVPPLGELLLEAERISHPAMRELLRRLGHPHDRLILRDGKVLRIAPLPRPLEMEKSPQLKVQVVDATGQMESQRSLLREEVARAEYFETFAVQEVVQLAREAGKLQPPLPASQVLELGDLVLGQVRAFHREAVRQGWRKEGWEELDAQLQKQERQIRLQRLSALQQEERWEEARQWADRLLALYPGDAEMVSQFRQLVETTADRAIARGDFAAVRRALDRLRHRLPGTTSPNIERFQRVLQERADFHLKQAQKFQEAQDMVSAWLAGAEAARLLPQWERVQLFQRQILRQYPFLIVGVPELPRSTWPGDALSLPEQMAVALLYEWLLEPRQPPLTWSGYWSSPGLVPFRDRGGWMLFLPAMPVQGTNGAAGRPLRVQDIRFSLEYAGQPTQSYYDPRWDKRLAEWHWEEGAGWLRLERSLLARDGLQLLHAPLLIAPSSEGGPAANARPHSAQSPLNGTGPYMLVQSSETEWVFRVRPGWVRSHVPDGPVLREIRFRRYRDVRQAHEDLECGAVHMVVGLTAWEADRFADLSHVRTVCLARQEAAPSGVAFTPRVAMLAFHRRHPIIANVELRRAISAAIDRESLVRQFYRGRDPTTYRISGGPVPIASWAYAPEYSPVTRSPYRPALARELFQRLRLTLPPGKVKTAPELLPKPLVLWVVAEAGPGVAVAYALAEQLAEYGVKIQVHAVSPRELFEAWKKSDPPYDALLWVAEYPHEGVTPFRWLSPAPPGQAWPDPFALADEPTIAQLRQQFLHTDDPSVLRSTLHQLHRYLVEQAWVVPLWEVDSFVAVRQGLQVGRFHPLWVLHHVENWSWN
ncbi:hypothetical protein HRbin36_01407 [bacterium HR36]|nr:hypothetical protein HRbin36_01407 [bacterium HR36]